MKIKAPHGRIDSKEIFGGEVIGKIDSGRYVPGADKDGEDG